ncbi:MAG: hypothetical protein AAF728_13250 [Cyanobacteria bacterium P01_D01_bin.128]
MLDRLLEFSPTLGLDTFLLLIVLIALEALLSADNAIALAAIAQGLESKEMEGRALNIGLVIAFVLRMALILTAGWVLRFWQFEVLGAVYLLWLVFQYFALSNEGEEGNHGPRFSSVWQAVPMIAVTDLAFSLDSVTTAIALSREIWLVLLGGMIGVITLRFMAGLFIRWLDEYVHLEDAGFVTVGLVGLRLLVRVINEDWVPPEWMMISAIALLFVWGFSKRKPEVLDAAEAEPDSDQTVAAADHPELSQPKADDAEPNNGAIAAHHASEEAQTLSEDAASTEASDSDRLSEIR